MVSAKFLTAAEHSRKLTTKPNNENLLKLYALFKVANEEDIEASPTPGMFDIKGKAKRSAWLRYIEEEPLTAAEAEKRYIELVEDLKKSCGFDPDKVPEKTSSD